MRRSWSRGRLAVLVASTAVAAVTIAGNPAVASAAPPPPSLPTVAAEPTNTPATALPATVAGAPAPQAREVPGLRTERSRTVEIPGHGFRTTVSGAPVNYRDARGGWQPIDTTLVRDGASWRPKAAGWTAELPATLGAAPITVYSGGRWVSLAPAGAAAVTGTAKGSRITYADAFPGVSLVYDALPTGLKESVLLARPGVRTDFGFTLRASAGLSAAAKGDAVQVTDGAGATVFALPAGFVLDDADAVSGRAAVTTTLSGAAALTASTGSGLRLSVAAPWLSAPGRRWPVTLDPTVTIGASQITDCHIADSTLANTSLCNNDFLEFGYGNSSSGYYRRRALLKFDLAAIPKSAVIKAADLKLVRESAGQVAATFPAQAMRVAKDWNTSATWNSPGITGTTWTAGGTYGPTQMDARPVNNQDAEVHFYIPYLVQLWVQGAYPNYGVELTSANEATIGHARFGASSDPVATSRPEFSVDWTVQQGQRDTNTFVTRKLSDRCEAGGNVGNGNLMLRCTELSVGGVGQSVDVSRYWNSGNGPTFLNRADNPLGINRWRLSTGVYLVIRPNSVEYTDGSGAVYPFHQLGGTAFRQAPGLGATLEKDQPAAGQYRIKFHKSGAQYVFTKTNSDFYNVTQQLWKIIDRNGNTTEFSYVAKAGYAEGALSTIKDTRGRLVTFGYTLDSGSGKDFLTSITDSTGRHANYSYTGWSLTTATDMDGDTTTYGYADFGTSNAQLSTFTDARTHATQFGYDTNGRVLDVNQHPNGTQTANTHFTYNDTVSPPTTTVRDPNSNSTVYEIEHKDYASRVTKATDAKGKQRSRTFTSNAQVGSVSDEFGTTTNTWDQNLADAGSPDSGESLTKSVGPSGATTLNEYRSATGTACPTGAAVSGNGYNAICSRDDAANKSTYSYDGPGNRSASKNALAATAKVDHAVNGSTYTPTDGRVVKSTDPLGRVTTYNYADVTFNAVTTKRLASITAPTGSLLGTRTVTYDGLDRLRTYTTGRSTVATRTYDGADRLTDVTYSDSTPALHYTYDGNGNLTARTLGTATTTFGYDWMNRPTSKTLPGSITLSYSYDLVGNLKTSVQDGVTTSYDYDTVNQVIRMTERSGRVTRFAYRSDGKRTDTWYNANATDPPSTFAAHIHTDFTSGGQVSRIKTTRASSDADANRVTDYSFCYRPRTVTGATCTTAKDETNDRSKIQWVVNNIDLKAFTLTYDGAGRLTQKADIGGGTTSTSTYDSNGNRTSEKETGKTDRYFGFTSGNAMCWTASVAGSSTGCTPPAGAQTTWTYDEAGNQTVNPDATAVYNGTEQTTSITAGGTTTPFGYAADNQTERTSKGGTNYVNGLLGLQSESGTNGQFYYERDPSGQLVSERTPAGDFYYVFDQNGSVLALIDPSGEQRASYSYSPWGEDRGTVAVGTGGLPPNPYRFHGQYLDSATGLYKMGLRYYSPKYARWTQQDSIESIGDPSNGNRYAFAGDDPINNTDPSGASYLDINVGWISPFFVGPDVGVQIGEDGISPYIGLEVGFPRGLTASVTGSDTRATQSGGWAYGGGFCVGWCWTAGKDLSGDGTFSESGPGIPGISGQFNFYFGPYGG